MEICGLAGNTSLLVEVFAEDIQTPGIGNHIIHRNLS